MQRYSSFFFCLIFYCIILVCCVCLLVFTFFIVIFQLKFSKDPLEEIILLFVEKNVFLISLYIYIRVSNWQNLTHLRIVVSNVWKIAYFYTELPTSKRCVPFKLHSKPRKSELMQNFETCSNTTYDQLQPWYSKALKKSSLFWSRAWLSINKKQKYFSYIFYIFLTWSPTCWKPDICIWCVRKNKKKIKANLSLKF